MPFPDILFSKAQHLIQIGRQRTVQPSDSLVLPVHLDPENIPWNETAVDWTSRNSFLKTLFKVSWSTTRIAITLQLFCSLFSFSTPFLVHAFISRLQKGSFSSADLIELVILALGFGIGGAGNGLILQHYFYRTLNFNQITSNLVNKKIFQHSLKLSARAKNKFQVGDIVNFMSSDSDAIADSAVTVIDLSNAVLLLTGCTITLFYFIGWSAVVAVVVMAALVPLTQKLSKTFLILENQMMTYRDQRMTLMTQVMNAIRVVKYFVWEKSILAEVSEVRRLEVQARYQLAKAEILWGLIYTSISSVVLFVALLTHVLRGFPIDLALIFTCISIFAIMEDHFGGLSKFISRFINILVSSGRIIEFLKSDVVSNFPDLNYSAQKSFIEFKNLTFKYAEQDTILKNLNFSLEQGQSLAVIGPVGCGKSTFLSLLLKELKATAGELHFKFDSTQAFASQDAFIINTTLRQNILFGATDFSDQKIQNALHVSALEYDILSLSAGLETEIGEKGVNLSGGQKQRVCLARAVMSDAEFILLDDPLSAVDPMTEKILCDRLLFGLWHKKTRVVVTHRLESLNRFDRILFLQDGLNYFGTFNELCENCAPFKKFLQTHIDNKGLENNVALQTSAGKNLDLLIPIEPTATTRITEDEDRALGAVHQSVYFDYIKALIEDGKFQKLILWGLFLGAVGVVAAPVLQKLWLSQSSHFANLAPLRIILIYGALGLLTMLVVFLSNSFWARRGIKAGQLFHDRMLSSVLFTRIRFFDSTPIGRILQRFSRDVESVDIHLQWSFDHTIHSLFHITVSFLLIVLILPLVIIFLIPVLFIYYQIQNDYRRVAREVKRLDSVARSPRFAHFKETLQGLYVIRAFRQTAWAENQFFQKMRHSQQMFYTHYMVNRWFSVRIPLIGAGISTLTCLVIVFSSYHGYLSAGTAGLVTIYALDFWRHLNWGVRIFSELESRMTSVERLQFYTHLQREEKPNSISPAAAWPQSGQLEFKNVNVRYAAHLPLVLKNVSFVIPSGSRAGLIGRTGSGKSTIFQTVYRFVDIDSGDIFIDHHSIQHLPLDILRKNLAVIPQDPNLFMGSLRRNIDRYDEANDEAIWHVLSKVSLASFVRNLPNQLNFKVEENGANLSQGQRQLICLARALLMKVKIIFLDEATASVDVDTDALVQKVIRNSLEGITLVTIAHRLSTLDGYDMILELQNGQIRSL